MAVSFPGEVQPEETGALTTGNRLLSLITNQGFPPRQGDDFCRTCSTPQNRGTTTETEAELWTREEGHDGGRVGEGC